MFNMSVPVHSYVMVHIFYFSLKQCLVCDIFPFTSPYANVFDCICISLCMYVCDYMCVGVR